ncbi:MAG: DNA-directed RNA polymerase subunit alpha, partial [Deltaproteobacteria bacterium]|nr:DNA-directed RNA polymerase subunit alpha [Deltaproteobacteria bacterium]
EPLERGFAVTIGNSLRRILLSSIQGAAITTVKIEGALHEFTSMKDIMEDVSEIILNLKMVRIKLHSGESQTVSIDKQGSGAVTANDISGNSFVEVMNKDQLICTLTGDASFKAELTVEWGKGYQPAESQDKENLSIGQIPIDAIFTPIKKIQYVTSQARVGQRTDYDKMTMEIETDGSLKPESALAYAAKILKEQMAIFVNFDEEEAEPEIDVVLEAEEPANPYLDKPVEDLELSVRSANCLKNADIHFIGDLAQKSDQEMLKTKNFGRKSLNEIKALLAEMDLTLGMKFENWTPPDVKETNEQQG